jgi:hypothetical protein
MLFDFFATERLCVFSILVVREEEKVFVSQALLSELIPVEQNHDFLLFVLAIQTTRRWPSSRSRVGGNGGRILHGDGAVVPPSSAGSSFRRSGDVVPFGGRR